MFDWRPLADMWSANRAEHKHTGRIELTVYDIDGVIGWEVHGYGSQCSECTQLLASGKSDTFDAAKHAAEQAAAEHHSDR